MSYTYTYAYTYAYAYTYTNTYTLHGPGAGGRDGGGRPGGRAGAHVRYMYLYMYMHMYVYCVLCIVYCVLKCPQIQIVILHIYIWRILRKHHRCQIKISKYFYFTIRPCAGGTSVGPQVLLPGSQWQFPVRKDVSWPVLLSWFTSTNLKIIISRLPTTCKCVNKT